MAGKKPAKPIAGQGRDKGIQLPGKATLYYSPSNKMKGFSCPTCSRTLLRGIVYEEGGNLFCKRSCIVSQ